MPHQDESSTTLDKARRGDREAFDSLAEESRRPLQGHIQSRMGTYLRSRMDSEDVLQETLARAWKSLAGFRGSHPKALLSWLKTIAEHVILDLAARGGRQQVVYLPETGEKAHAQASPSRIARQEERFSRLRDALNSLSPEHREVITLVRLQGLKIQQAAEKMERTPNAVVKLLTRALTRLKEAFGDTDSLHLPPRPLVGEGDDRRDG